MCVVQSASDHNRDHSGLPLRSRHHLCLRLYLPAAHGCQADLTPFALSVCAIRLGKLWTDFDEISGSSEYRAVSHLDHGLHGTDHGCAVMGKS